MPNRPPALLRRAAEATLPKILRRPGTARSAVPGRGMAPMDADLGLSGTRAAVASGARAGTIRVGAPGR